jgi:hypothetical protein
MKPVGLGTCGVSAAFLFLPPRTAATNFLPKPLPCHYWNRQNTPSVCIPHNQATAGRAASFRIVETPCLRRTAGIPCRPGMLSTRLMLSSFLRASELPFFPIHNINIDIAIHDGKCASAIAILHPLWDRGGEFACDGPVIAISSTVI